MKNPIKFQKIENRIEKDIWHYFPHIDEGLVWWWIIVSRYRTQLTMLSWQTISALTQHTDKNISQCWRQFFCFLPPQSVMLACDTGESSSNNLSGFSKNSQSKVLPVKCTCSDSPLEGWKCQISVSVRLHCLQASAKNFSVSQTPVWNC